MRRRARFALAAFFAASIGGPALAQSLAPPDPARYPALASLVDWLKSSAREARNCSATVAMTLSARAAYEKTRSDVKAVETIARALVVSAKGQLDETRARILATGYVRTAQQFMALPAEASGLAIAALCRSAVERHDRPFAEAERVKQLVAQARACTATGFAEKVTSYVTLECVVNAMSQR